MRDRYVLLGLGRPRADWFRSVAQWSTSAALPAEFVKCVSIGELLARLDSGRPYSAVLVDGALPGLDRDVIDVARRHGAAVLVVGASRSDWAALGATAVLPEVLTRDVLLDALATFASTVGSADPVVDDVRTETVAPGSAAIVLAVCGPGGTGASTTAMALAQGLVNSHREADVVLVDFALRAEQAMLHDVRDVVPGVQELVEAHRSGAPGDDEVRALTYEITGRGYDLLLGLRRARHWASLRERAFLAGFEALRRAYDIVVSDVDADVDGDDIGTPDVADRNLMARTTVALADLVLVVGRPTAKGVHALVRTITELAVSGVPGERLMPVVVEAPRSPRARGELTGTVSTLTRPSLGGAELCPVLFLPGRRVDEAVRDGLPMPAPLPAMLAGAVATSMAQLGGRVVRPSGPVLVQPGSFGL